MGVGAALLEGPLTVVRSEMARAVNMAVKSPIRHLLPHVAVVAEERGAGPCETEARPLGHILRPVTSA